MTSRLALGTAQFGLKYGVANESGQINVEQGASILTQAQKFGIDLLDTAIAYGQSESTLGAIGVKSLRVVSKLPAIPQDCTDVVQWVLSEVQQSLHRLRINSLYGLLLHRPSQLTDNQGPALVDAFQQVKECGWVQKTGISIYTPDELQGISELITLDLVQAPLNLFDRRLVESGWAEKLKSEGTELHVRSAFLQGLLLMPSEKRPKKLCQWTEIWQTWDDWLRHTALTPLQACMAYVLSIKEVDRVVFGVEGVAQLQEIHASTSATLPDLPMWKSSMPDDLVNPSRWSQL